MVEQELGRTSPSREEPLRPEEKEEDDEEKSHRLLVTSWNIEEPKPMHTNYKLFKESNEVCTENGSPEVPFPSRNNCCVGFNSDGKCKHRREVLIYTKVNAAQRCQDSTYHEEKPMERFCTYT